MYVAARPQDVIAREIRCKWSDANDKASLVAAQDVLTTHLPTLKVWLVGILCYAPSPTAETADTRQRARAFPQQRLLLTATRVHRRWQE